MDTTRPHTIIGLKKTTKSRLNKQRAPGQCYDGFLCQLMDIWEESNKKRQNSPDKAFPEHIINTSGEEPRIG